MDETPSDQNPGPQPSDRYPAGSPWGFWCTLLFSAIILSGYVGVSLITAVALGAVEHSRNPNLDIETYLTSLEWDGLYLSIVTFGTLLICGGLIILFVALRREITASDYLLLKRVPAASLLRWILVTALFAVLYDISNVLLNRDIVPRFMVQVYLTARVMPLFWLAVVVAAPLIEEIFFRGFVFAGFSASPLGPKLTTGLTAIAWGGIHLQYEMYDILLICLFGLILGLARSNTNSLYTPLIMHSLLNLFATLEVWLLIRMSN